MPRPKEFENEKRITVKVEGDLHKEAKRKAAQSGKTLSQALREWLTKWTGEDPPNN